jgi:DNA-binding SARP family transcriptional activator
LHNLAEALVQLGSYDEASWHLHRAIALCRHLGTGRTALGLLGLAEIDRQLGHDQRARARYLEAVELARGSRETQVLVPALAGLARSYAAGQDDDGLDRAQAAAEEALQVATPPLRPFALTAAGWVALRRDDRPRASALARQSVATAREMAAFDLLAEALELAAATAGHDDDARLLLTEALSIWQGGGAAPAAHRIELQLGWLEGADSTARSRARDAARELQRLGTRHVNGRPVSTAGSTGSVGVTVLGGFRVQVEGAEVPVPAWRSRQARTLVKILAARRGRPATRAWLCETLWPDDDPAKTGHRLAVLLATVRAVLDPGRRWPTDRYVSADLRGIWLDLRHVTLDADTLIRDAEVAAALMDSGEPDRAAEILADINARYRGEAFEDEPGEEWADGVREEVRAAWQRSVRRLAALSRRAGRIGDAQTLLVRLLVADPYDEKIHLLLVKSLLSAGRHGEARRAFDRWSTAMRDIGAPPPDPGVLGSRPAGPPRLASVVTPY